MGTRLLTKAKDYSGSKFCGNAWQRMTEAEKKWNLEKGIPSKSRNSRGYALVYDVAEYDQYIWSFAKA